MDRLIPRFEDADKTAQYLASTSPSATQAAKTGDLDTAKARIRRNIEVAAQLVKQLNDILDEIDNQEDQTQLQTWKNMRASLSETDPKEL